MSYSTYFAYLGIALACVYLVTSLQVAFTKGLRQVPGPLVARFSGLYRLSLVLRGQTPEEYRKVHQKYGPIVRVGPDHVSVSDPSTIPVIYGISSRFLKASGDVARPLKWRAHSHRHHSTPP
jgi:hypothetical protein